jgi:phospholipase D1/2
MPLLPGFEGDISDRANGPLRYQVNNQFLSINRGENSLLHKLKDLENFNIDDYIFFFGLRNHGILESKPHTEIIYVHSKLMIVDDKRAIIGSANINDRSLCGNRDSELAIVIEEDNGEILDGVPRRKGIFDLRARLFHEHFGLTRE